MDRKTDQREAIRRDPVRLRLKEMLRRNDLTLMAASLAIGRNQTYLQQYVDRGVPAVLGYRDSQRLADRLGCDPSELCHDTVPKRRTTERRHPRPPAGLPGAPVAAIPEITVEVTAGAGAVVEEFFSETAPWYWPENMIRYESGAAPENLRIIRVRGNSMEPEMSEGDLPRLRHPHRRQSALDGHSRLSAGLQPPAACVRCRPSSLSPCRPRYARPEPYRLAPTACAPHAAR